MRRLRQARQLPLQPLLTRTLRRFPPLLTLIPWSAQLRFSGSCESTESPQLFSFSLSVQSRLFLRRSLDKSCVMWGPACRKATGNLSVTRVPCFRLCPLAFSPDHSILSASRPPIQACRLFTDVASYCGISSSIRPSSFPLSLMLFEHCKNHLTKTSASNS